MENHEGQHSEFAIQTAGRLSTLEANYLNLIGLLTRMEAALAALAPAIGAQMGVTLGQHETNCKASVILRVGELEGQVKTLKKYLVVFSVVTMLVIGAEHKEAVLQLVKALI